MSEPILGTNEAGNPAISFNPVPKSVALKMHKAMARIGAIDKSAKNVQQGYMFQPWNEIQAQVRAALIAEGLLCLTTLSQHIVKEAATQKGNALYQHQAWVHVTFVDADTGDSWTNTWSGEAFETGDKGLQKAITSAVKYALLKTFLISDKDTKDNDAETPEPAPVSERVKSKLDDAEWFAFGKWFKSIGGTSEQFKWLKDNNCVAVLNAKEKGLTTPEQIMDFAETGELPQVHEVQP